MSCTSCRAVTYGNLELRVIESEETFAGACRAPRPMVVMSSELERQLSALEVLGVVEHERAHLEQRHHVVVFAALVQVTLLPRSRCAVLPRTGP